VPLKPKGASANSFEVRPPIVQFIWEDFTFLGAVVDLDVDFLVMDEEGKARRAKVEIEMKGRAFTGGTSLADFLDAIYTPPTATGSGAKLTDDRADLIKAIQ
jgi:hypothetical protein